MDDDSTFVPLASPVGSLMAQVERRMRANQALANSAVLSTSDNPVLRRKALENIVKYEREAVAQQLGK